MNEHETGENMKQKNFTTLDLYLSAFLESNGIQPNLETNNGRVVFSFPQSEELYKLISAYNSNESVPIADYIYVLKNLKGRMLSKRGER